jgi:hypothetical protein
MQGRALARTQVLAQAVNAASAQVPEPVDVLVQAHHVPELADHVVLALAQASRKVAQVEAVTVTEIANSPIKKRQFIPA